MGTTAGVILVENLDVGMLVGGGAGGKVVARPDGLARPPRKTAVAQVGAWAALLLSESDLIAFADEQPFLGLSANGRAVGGLVSTVIGRYGFCLAAYGEMRRRVLWE